MESKPIIERYQALRAVLEGYWLNTFREVRRYVMPSVSYDAKSEGGIRGQEIFDTTAIEARERLAAGMYNWMAPPDKRWFELLPQDDRLQQDEEVKEYFAQVTKRISFAMANSNWASVLIEALNNLACGFDGIVYCEDGGVETALKFRSFAVETVCYSEDATGKVDTVFRELEMTARQLVQQFEAEDLPETIRNAAADPKKKDQKFKILHAVFPRENRDERMADNKNMPIVDVYIDLQSKKVIHEGGFEEHPFAVCHFYKADNETYGRGPGVNRLPSIKMLNRMVEAYILLSEHQADPSWLLPDGSLVDKEFKKGPGSVNFYKPDLTNAKPEMIPHGGNLAQLFQDIEAERQKIKIGFFWDIFDPLGDLKQITATEAEIRNEGKMIPFAPIAGNLHSELFKPIISRVFGILQRRGMLPELPVKLAENPDYKIEFVSKIALSIKKIESLGWLQTEASLANIAQMNPEVIDNFDLDEITRNMAMVNGVSPEWIRSVKDRDQIRAERAQATEQAQAQQMLMDGAGIMGNNLSKAPEPGSPLDAVLSGQGV